VGPKSGRDQIYEGVDPAAENIVPQVRYAARRRLKTSPRENRPNMAEAIVDSGGSV
jgi:hypothetical protein